MGAATWAQRAEGGAPRSTIAWCGGSPLGGEIKCCPVRERSPGREGDNSPCKGARGREVAARDRGGVPARDGRVGWGMGARSRTILWSHFSLMVSATSFRSLGARSLSSRLPVALRRK